MIAFLAGNIGRLVLADSRGRPATAAIVMLTRDLLLCFDWLQVEREIGRKDVSRLPNMHRPLRRGFSIQPVWPRVSSHMVRFHTILVGLWIAHIYSEISEQLILVLKVLAHNTLPQFVAMGITEGELPSVQGSMQEEQDIETVHARCYLLR